MTANLGLISEVLTTSFETLCDLVKLRCALGALIQKKKDMVVSTLSSVVETDYKAVHYFLRLKSWFLVPGVSGNINILHAANRLRSCRCSNTVLQEH